MVNKLNQHGFTIGELMIGLAIFFILTALGIPSYLNYIHDGSRDNTVTALYSDIYYARSEALKLKQTVYICPSANVTAATPACSAATQDWSTGWLVYFTNNGNNVLLKVGSPAKTGIHVMANVNAQQIAFASDGSLATIPNAVFAVCDNRDGSYDPNYGRDITIQAMGSPQINNTTDPNNANQTCAP